MFKKLVALLVLLALGNTFFSGCTHTVVRTLPEVGSLSSYQVNGVVTTEGETVRFGAPHGRYNRTTRIVTGLLEDGSRYHAKLDDLTTLFIIDLADETPVEMEILSSDLPAMFDQTEPKRVREVVTLEKKRYRFDRAGGRIDAAARAVVGNDRNGTAVNVPIAEVSHVKIREVDGVATAGILIGVALLVVAMASWSSGDWFDSGGWDWNN